MGVRTGQIEMSFAMDAALERAEDWAGKARDSIYDVYGGYRLTADDVRDWVGPPPGRGDSMGPVFRAAAQEGLIRHVGFTTSQRPDAHGRVLRVWERL